MNKKSIIIIIILILAVFAAFTYLSGSPAASTSSLSADTSTTDSSDAKQIYALLQEMAQVKLDDSIFSSNQFQGLKDNSVTFATQPVGRNNPFSPIGSSVAPVSGNATTTK